MVVLPCQRGDFEKLRCENVEIMKKQNHGLIDQQTEMMEMIKMFAPLMTLFVVVVLLCCFGACCTCVCCHMTSKRGMFGRLVEMKWPTSKVMKRKVKADAKKIPASERSNRNPRANHHQLVNIPFAGCDDLPFTTV